MTRQIKPPITSKLFWKVKKPHYCIQIFEIDDKDFFINSKKRKTLSVFNDLVMNTIQLVTDIQKFNELPVLYYGNSNEPLVNIAGVTISISHSGGLLAIACAYKSRVGVDIQVKKNINERHAQIFMSQKELTEPKLNYLASWCVKESYAKALGLGFLLPFKQIRPIRINATKYMVINSTHPESIAEIVEFENHCLAYTLVA